jgi:hypothetical protein
MNSSFTPIGQLPNGYWLENTGLLNMFLTVAIIEGGRHWRCLKMKVGGLRLWLFPHSTAGKTIEGENADFTSAFHYPYSASFFPMAMCSPQILRRTSLVDFRKTGTDLFFAYLKLPF